ncbi:MAG: SpoIIE family protein phosphatase [Microscillaceae bacterium]|jgi:serine phosphatase RsbU (regulator of sigma subunit)|nr:SpoIIE family protein phosphatase [Microscillaceae bacterium]
MIKRVGCIWLIWILAIFPLWAQKTLQGKITDEKAAPIQEVQISVDGSAWASNQTDGSFSLQVTNSNPKLVKIKKEGWLIKSWQMRNGQLEVILGKPMTIRGRVISQKGFAVADIRVMLVGVRGLEPTKTDNEGFFSLEVPQGTNFNNPGQFLVFDPGRLKSTANYEVKITEDGVVYLKVDVPPRLVRKVKVMDNQNQPVANTTVYVDNAPFTTDAAGEFKPDASASDFSYFRADALIINRLEYIDLGSVMNVYARRPIEGETLTKQNVSTIDEKRDAVFAEKSFLDQENERLTTEIAKIKARFESGENISTAERTRLEQQLQQLEAKLVSNQQALDIVREKAENVILSISKEFSVQKQLTQQVQDKLNQTQAEKEAIKLKNKLNQQQARQNIIISMLVIGALLAIVLVYYFNYRKINKQKIQLSESLSEINQKNLLLEESARIMDLKNKQINDKNEQLIAQTRELELKNLKITDSLRYARSIQQSILPSIEQIAHIFPHYFVFYEPKDIVSGDFYWLTQKGDEVIFAAADCTGHGVPGAFMTMLGNASLNHIVNEVNITSPAEILTDLNDLVAGMIRREEEDLREGDGMDIAIIKLNIVNKELVFAGSKLPMYLIQNQEIQQIKGSSVSIGSSPNKKEKVFENQFLQLQSNDVIYFSSDGFHDQLGGVNSQNEQVRRKFTRKKMMDLLFANHQLPFVQQQHILKSEFETWKGSNDQTDDVLVVGIKV